MAEPFLAEIRTQTARYLYSNHYTQKQIAELLQISQPVISGYIKKKSSLSKFGEDLQQQTRNIGEQIGKLLETNGANGIPQAIENVCIACKKIRQGGIACVYHKLSINNLENDCTRCLTQQEFIELQTDRTELLSCLRRIYQLLIATNKYNFFIPEIGLQIVLGTDEMIAGDDIAAFPERIIKRKKGIPIAQSPSFGTSETMSNLLLEMKKHYPKTIGIAGLKTSEWLSEKIVQLKLTRIDIQGFDVDYQSNLEVMKTQQLEIKFPFIIVDQGSIGYEAISYLCVDSPTSLEKVFSRLLN